MNIWLLLATVAFGSILVWILSEGRARDRFGNKIYKPIRLNLDQEKRLRLPLAPADAKAVTLVLDTETTGLPTEEGGLDPSLGRIAVLQLAWILLDQEGRKIEEHCHLLRQLGVEVSAEVENIHHISTERMLSEGREPRYVYELFVTRLVGLPTVVAHNAAYHLTVLQQDMQLHGVDPELLYHCPSFCTMESGVDAAHIVGAAGRWKLPKLRELFGVLCYGRPHLELVYSNKALSDVRMAAVVYNKLSQAGY
ncbi:MAG: 3'-5' exonuclease [Porphyromonas sp.]|nr:3'-5' exonuclease [Porphyromonas sp.]